MKWENKGTQKDKMPILAVLLTYRHDTGILGVRALIEKLQEDQLARVFLVIATDIGDQSGLSFDYTELEGGCVEKVIHLVNQKFEGPSFPICKIWNRMACEAFNAGATWCVLLGDDVILESPDYYRRIYRCFMDIRQKFMCKVPLGFGCCYFNDKSFPNFPTFPVIGRVHLEIMDGELYPKHHVFINQDLDPYIQRLYLEVGAGPPVDVSVTNKVCVN